LKKSNLEAFKFALVNSLVLILIVSIPIYFYVTLSLRHSQSLQKIELVQFSNLIQSYIYRIEKNDIVFEYPRSVVFASEILDKNRNSIFSLVNQESIARIKTIRYEVHLLPNKLNATYLVCYAKTSNESAVLNAFWIILVVVGFIFLFTFFLARQALVSYEKTNAMLERFFKDAMHELKTPLGIIQINLDILRCSIENKAINRASAAIKSLATIYDDIEFMIKNKKVKFSKETINFSEFLIDRIEFFEDLSAIKKIKIISNIESNLNIVFNRQELQRIIDNTISNAIKYSNADTTIVIELILNEHQILFSVKDNGCGIDDIEKIFLRYYRGDAIKGGFGIGLSIVKFICDKTDTKIFVESSKESGSKFSYLFSKVYSQK
jgi:signal transduction histidine kinase